MDSATNTQALKNKTIEYQGRKTSRVKSEQRRREILEATLRIVRTEGVRGIRHRAVAKEAAVPLAATTYYFKDIDELIVDAFTLYTEKALLVLKDFTAHFYQPLSQLLMDTVGNAEQRNHVLEFMTDQVTEYMRGQLVDQYDMLTIEQAFRYEALVNEKIRELGQIHRQALYAIAVEFFSELVHSKQPEADAEILIGLFHNIEYNALLNGQENIDMDKIRRVIKHYIHLIVNNLLVTE